MPTDRLMLSPDSAKRAAKRSPPELTWIWSNSSSWPRSAFNGCNSTSDAQSIGLQWLPCQNHRSQIDVIKMMFMPISMAFAHLSFSVSSEDPLPFLLNNVVPWSEFVSVESSVISTVVSRRLGQISDKTCSNSHSSLYTQSQASFLILISITHNSQSMPFVKADSTLIGVRRLVTAVFKFTKNWTIKRNVLDNGSELLSYVRSTWIWISIAFWSCTFHLIAGTNGKEGKEVCACQ